MKKKIQLKSRLEKERKVLKRIFKSFDSMGQKEQGNGRVDVDKLLHYYKSICKRFGSVDIDKIKAEYENETGRSKPQEKNMTSQELPKKVVHPPLWLPKPPKESIEQWEAEKQKKK